MKRVTLETDDGSTLTFRSDTQMVHWQTFDGAEYFVTFQQLHDLFKEYSTIHGAAIIHPMEVKSSND